MFGSWTQTLVIGSARYSANAPGRLTPTPLVSLQRCRRPARQLRQRPQTTCPSPLTISPTWKSLTFEPTSTISPDELVADHHRHRDRLLRPGVPVVDMHVGAADPGAQHLDQHVVDADPRAPAPRRARDPAWPPSSRGPASSPSWEFPPTFVQRRSHAIRAKHLCVLRPTLKANVAARMLQCSDGVGRRGSRRGRSRGVG